MRNGGIKMEKISCVKRKRNESDSAEVEEQSCCAGLGRWAGVFCLYAFGGNEPLLKKDPPLCCLSFLFSNLVNLLN